MTQNVDDFHERAGTRRHPRFVAVSRARVAALPAPLTGPPLLPVSALAAVLLAHVLPFAPLATLCTMAPPQAGRSAAILAELGSSK
jgi:hypothetical protein